MEYTIAAIPTEYRGRRYRSRLEARWAAFFDLLGWHHEYEPCDLGSWSPDFALWGKQPNRPVLVEIKPIEGWDRQTARKMADAYDCYTMTASHLLLLGFSPFGTQLGWLAEPRDYEASWTEALFGATLEGRADFVPNAGDWCQESILWEAQYDLERLDPEALWIKAANHVQWRPKRGGQP